MVTDDTVLEEHNEDPALLQMRLIGDGGSSHENLCIEKQNAKICLFVTVVESIMRGENVGITARRSRSSSVLTQSQQLTVRRLELIFFPLFPLI